MRMRVLLGFLLMSGCFDALPARATDGVLEINQACVAGGCFPGDSPGFPVQITNEGAYRLTSNLVVPVGVVGGVYIGSKVDLDLNGFVIRGPGTCSGNGGSVSCVGLSGYGVVVDSGSPASVRRGTITGVNFGIDVPGSRSVALSDLVVQATGTGIFGRSATISLDRVRVEQTSGSCMFFQAFAVSGLTLNIRSGLVKDCHDSGIAVDPSIRLSVVDMELARIGNLGIVASNDAAIRDVRISGAGSDGVVCADHCRVEGSHFAENGGRGVAVGASSSIEGNDFGPNGATAIVAGDGSTISRNTIAATDGLTGNVDGIQCGAGCGVFENVIRPAKTPIVVGPSSRTSRNVMSLYELPPQLGVSAGDNLCSGTDC